MPTLTVLAYLACSLAGVAAVARIRMPGTHSAGHRYLTVIPASWAITLLLWAPPTRAVLAHVPGHHPLIRETAATLQIVTAGVAALLGSYLRSTSSRRAHRRVLATVTGVVSAVLVSQVVPPVTVVRWLPVLLWGAGVAAGYAYYLHHVLRWRHVRDPIIRTGLTLSIIAAVGGVVWAGSHVALVTLVSHQGTLVRGLMLVEVGCAVGITAASALSGLTPWLAPSVLSTVHRLHARWYYRRLRWLRAALVTAGPDTDLSMITSRSTHHELLWRRVVEIRDAQAHVRTYAHPQVRHWVHDVAVKHGLNPSQVSLLDETAELALGLDAQQRGGRRYHHPVPRATTWPAQETSLLAEARWLCKVQRTWRRTRLVAVGR